MKTISSLIENVIKKHTSENLPEIKESISNNLEFRLLFTIDFSKPFKEAKKDFLKNYLNDLLVLSLGNVSLAAKKAHIHRRHLHRIINELRLKPIDHKKELIKPSQYMKENVHNILEETLDSFREEKKLKTIYSNLADISEIIAEHIENIPYEDALHLFEKEYIEKALKLYNYNIQKTADSMDMSERTLYRKISKLNIAVA